jgi:hypothetical protein
MITNPLKKLQRTYTELTNRLQYVAAILNSGRLPLARTPVCGKRFKPHSLAVLYCDGYTTKERVSIVAPLVDTVNPALVEGKRGVAMPPMWPKASELGGACPTPNAGARKGQKASYRNGSSSMETKQS